MHTIIVSKPFLFAENGNHVIEIETGEQQVSERCALVAVDHLKVAALPGSEPGDEPTAKAKPRARARK
jgi:hypothetical protein